MGKARVFYLLEAVTAFAEPPQGRGRHRRLQGAARAQLVARCPRHVKSSVRCLSRAGSPSQLLISPTACSSTTATRRASRRFLRRRVGPRSAQQRLGGVDGARRHLLLHRGSLVPRGVQAPLDQRAQVGDAKLRRLDLLRSGRRAPTLRVREISRVLREWATCRAARPVRRVAGDTPLCG